ncbi:hypothetical protein K8R43_04625 [archaeon]|nr:hypothetical protein [archaeon]
MEEISNDLLIKIKHHIGREILHRTTTKKVNEILFEFTYGEGKKPLLVSEIACHLIDKTFDDAIEELSIKKEVGELKREKLVFKTTETLVKASVRRHLKTLVETGFVKRHPDIPKLQQWERGRRYKRWKKSYDPTKRVYYHTGKKK